MVAEREVPCSLGRDVGAPGTGLVPGILLAGGWLHLGPLVVSVLRGVIQGGALAVPFNHCCLMMMQKLEGFTTSTPYLAR